MKINLELIDNPQALQNMISILAGETLLAFDTEFVREKTYVPKLGLLQVATRKECWLIDALALSKQGLAPFLEILTDRRILKILHSSQGDQETLYHTYGLTASPTLDTFEAASLVGLGESVGLQDLLNRVLGVKIGKSHSRTDWLKRPIHEDMKRYALSDVEHLVEVGERLLERLEELGRKEWALDLSATFENPRLYQDPSEEIAKRLVANHRVSRRSYPLLKELIAWREGRAKALDIPRRRIADDETLMDIANARPQSIEQLEKFRGLNSGEVKRQGMQLISIIKNNESRSEAELPPFSSPLKPTQSQSRIIDLLGTYLRVLSEDLQIASRQLLTAKELKKIVLENLTEPEQWVQAGLCGPQVAGLVGENLKALLKGKRSLKIEEGKIKIIHL